VTGTVLRVGLRLVTRPGRQPGVAGTPLSLGDAGRSLLNQKRNSSSGQLNLAAEKVPDPANFKLPGPSLTSVTSESIGLGLGRPFRDSDRDHRMKFLPAPARTEPSCCCHVPSQPASDLPVESESEPEARAFGPGFGVTESEAVTVTVALSGTLYSNCQ
jgi:hypothetical protein